ncbi:unnamed protein product [Ixodes hexagonus]
MFKVILDASKEQHLMYGDSYYLGKTIILLRCLQPTQTIFLHATGFTVKEHQATLVREGDKSFVGIGKMAVNDDLEMLKVDLDTPLEYNQTYSLSLEFAGSIHTAPRGLYKSFFTVNGQRIIRSVGAIFTPEKTRWLVSRMFPAGLPPLASRTAYFYISRPYSGSVYSVIELELNRGDMQEITKNKYPASHNANSAPVSAVPTAESVLIKVHGTIHQLQNSEYVLQVAPAIFSYYQESFRINYPFSKLDLVAMPTLPTPAMEHWGLITFQPLFLDYRKEETPFKLKLASLKLVARKIGQQWFGNLVTVAWWDHLWLKEGVSQYLAYSAASAADTQTDLLSTVLVEEVHNSMEYDGHNTSQPVEKQLNTPMQIRKHMNPAVIAKSVALVRMLAHLVPKNAFRVGIREFLKKYSYKSVLPEHLFKELHTVQRSLFGHLSVNLTSVMKSWLTQSGYPVVLLNRSYSENTAVVSQKRFIFGADPPAVTLWHVPISYVSEETPDFDSTLPKLWLKDREVVIPAMPPKNRWVILNTKETNYYKVNYDKTNWLMIISQLESDHKVIHEFNRAQLIDDSLDLARAGQLPYDLAFDVLEYLPKERGHVPWNTALANFQKLDPVLRHTKVYSKWKKFVNHLLNNQYERLMSEEHKEESLQTSILRTSILTLSCDYEHTACVTFCKKMLDNLRGNYESSYHMIPHSYRPIVFCQAIKHGTEADFNFLWKHYEMATTPQERTVLLKALSCTGNLQLLEKLLLQLVNKNSGVETTQKAANLLNAISSTSLSGSTSVVRFMSDHQEAVFNRYGSLQGLFDSILQSIVDNIQHESELSKLHEIYERTKDVLPSEEEKVLRMISNAREHIRWSSHFYRDVESWLDKRFFLDHQEMSRRK